MPTLPWITAVHLLGASSLTWPPTGKLRRRLTLTSDPGATLMVSFFSGSFPGFKMSDNFIVRLSTVSLRKITGSWSKKKIFFFCNFELQKNINIFNTQNQAALLSRSEEDTQKNLAENSLQYCKPTWIKFKVVNISQREPV